MCGNNKIALACIMSSEQSERRSSFPLTPTPPIILLCTQVHDDVYEEVYDGVVVV